MLKALRVWRLAEYVMNSDNALKARTYLFQNFSLWDKTYRDLMDMFWIYAANLQESIYAKYDFKATLLTLRYGCSPVNLLQIFRTHFSKNTCERLLL